MSSEPPVEFIERVVYAPGEHRYAVQVRECGSEWRGAFLYGDRKYAINRDDILAKVFGESNVRVVERMPKK